VVVYLVWLELVVVFVLRDECDGVVVYFIEGDWVVRWFEWCLDVYFACVV